MSNISESSQSHCNKHGLKERFFREIFILRIKKTLIFFSFQLKIIFELGKRAVKINVYETFGSRMNHP